MEIGPSIARQATRCAAKANRGAVIALSTLTSATSGMARSSVEPVRNAHARRHAPAAFRAMVSGMGERQCCGECPGGRNVTAHTSSCSPGIMVWPTDEFFSSLLESQAGHQERDRVNRGPVLPPVASNSHADVACEQRVKFAQAILLV